MTAKTSPEIIDLTLSSPAPECIIVSSEEDNSGLHAPGTQDPSTSYQEKETKRVRRKKRKKKAHVTGSQENTSTNTRESSLNLDDISEIPAKRRRSENSSQNYSKDIQSEQKRANETVTVSAQPEIISEPTEKDLFFVDVQPTAIPLVSSSSTSSPPSEENAQAKLLLPAHVFVLGSTPIEILPSSIPAVDDEAEDFIKYLDYEDHKEFVRYFEEKPSEESKLNRTVCKNCGAEGEHKSSACPVLICLTCGARNEHHTRSCPISKVCFTCGMKGHINANCPNRHQARALTSGRYDDCDRCGSRKHKTNECPTWWRLYEYLTEEERLRVISVRVSKKELKFGQGGEGYVADDEWCYNCGSCGHWGDDCNDAKRFDHPEEPSAFSLHNIFSGPFFIPGEESHVSNPHRRQPRDWEHDLDQWGVGAPQNVGRQGKRKQMDKLAKKAREQLDEDDPDDWFGSRNGRGTGQRQTKPMKGPEFGKSLQEAKRFHPLPARPSLLSRLGDEIQGNPPRPSERYNNAAESYSGRARNRDKERERDRDRHRDRDKYRGRDRPPKTYSRSKDGSKDGPRYTGDYPL